MNYKAILLIALVVLAPVMAQAANRVGASPEDMPGAIEVGGRSINTSTDKGSLLYQVREMQQQRLEELQGAKNHGQRVSAYVHGLLETSDMVEGGIGSKVREVARKMNESTNNMTRAEERVNRRSAVAKFLFGSDPQAVSELARSLNRTRERVQEMEQELDGVTDPDVQAVMREQIQGMNRGLQNAMDKVQAERKARGILGFLFRGGE